MYVIELPGMHCIGYVCATRHKDPEDELLCALLGTSRWQCSDDPRRDKFFDWLNSQLC